MLAKKIITEEFYNKAKNKSQQEVLSKLEEIDEEIKTIYESKDMEKYLDRLPNVLYKIFELSSKVLSNAEIISMRDEYHKLLKLATLELPVNTKKELTVKLFEGLEDVLNWKNELWLPELDSNQWPTG